jgi:DNA-binding response OmpR family regulator
MINNGINVLVVDDERKIVEIIKTYLEKDGFKVNVAFSGKEALDVFNKFNPHLVVLDLMLPDISGEEICKILRKNSGVPIIMLTAKVEEEDILKGLDIGADDYITKPFSPKQLIARINAVIRRTSDQAMLFANVISFNNDDLVINSISYEVKKKGRMLSLTPNEYKILMNLIKYPTKVFTRDELIDKVLGENYDGYDRTIDTHIKNLRQKIESDPKNPSYILTVHGIGYKFGGESA